MAGEHTFDELDTLAEGCCSALLAVDPGLLDGAGCERLLGLVTRTERRLALVRARLVRRAAEANRWRSEGDRSSRDWLARQTGTSPGRAGGELRFAEDLAAAPATEEALAAGRLSPEQAAEIAATAKVDPSAERALLDAAQKESLAELQGRARRARAAATDEAARRERIRKARRFRSWTDGEGAFCFTGRGLPEDGAALLAALKPYQDAAFAAARKAGVREPGEAYAYDGLINLITHAAGNISDTCSAGAADRTRTGEAAEADAGTGHDPDVGDVAVDDGDDGDDERGGHRARVPAKVIVHVDLSALRRGHTVQGETCEIAGIGPVAVSTARDLLGDAFLALVIEDGVDIRNVTHLGRAPTAHQRTALEARGKVCAVPGCGRTTGLEIDHVDGWAVTRRTHIDQLDWLCGGIGGHHHRKTHDGWTLTGPPGSRTWTPPTRTGPPHPGRDANGGEQGGACGDGVDTGGGRECRSDGGESGGGRRAGSGRAGGHHDGGRDNGAGLERGGGQGGGGQVAGDHRSGHHRGCGGHGDDGRSGGVGAGPVELDLRFGLGG